MLASLMVILGCSNRSASGEPSDWKPDGRVDIFLGPVPPGHRAMLWRWCEVGYNAQFSNAIASCDSNQQYSITAITDGSGGIVERYAYTAYGTPTITDASGTLRTTTAIGNRYTYTGREWDETLALYHYRARMYDSVGGRFVSRDPIGYMGGIWLLYGYVSCMPLSANDPTGLYQLPWLIARIVAQIPIVNLINAFFQELPGTNLTDYAGCMPSGGCAGDPGLIRQCNACVAQQAGANMLSALGTGALDGFVGAVIGWVSSHFGPIGMIYGAVHAISAWAADAITLGRATNEINAAARAAQAAYCR